MIEVVLMIVIYSLLSLSPWILSFIGTLLYQPAKKKKLEQRVQNSVQGGDNLSTLSKPLSGREVKHSQMVMANVVMSPSWVQLFIGFFISIFGGEIRVFTKVVDWARCEAQQRLRESVAAAGFDELINMRLETTMLTRARRGEDKTSGVEILAYGTAIKY